MNPATVLPFPNRYLPGPAAIDRHSRAPSPGAVRAQLSKILQSDGFVRARRMRRFLEFVVEETLAGHASQLCEYSIAISVFGRDKSFEPGLDPIVRNDARRLRQKLAEYYLRPRDEDYSKIRIEIPKGGYVPVFYTISNTQTSKPSKQYRLSITLVRVADGAEIWNTEQDFPSGNFDLQLSVTSTPDDQVGSTEPEAPEPALCRCPPVGSNGPNRECRSEQSRSGHQGSRVRPADHGRS